MRVDVDGRTVFAHTGGGELAAASHLVVLVHGAGNDHTVWRYQTRRLAGMGLAVVAPDLPGHGRSAGPPLGSVPAMAGWIIDLLDALAVPTATVVGHSMGSLIALQAAHAHPDRVTRIGLIATAPRMDVHPDLQQAADAGDGLAVDLIVGWSHNAASRFGGHRQAGVWTTQQTRRLLERNLTALGTDLAACAAHDATAAATDLGGSGAVDALVIAGAADKMTSAAAGQAMAALLGTPAVMIDRGSHVSLYDHPDAVNAALLPWLTEGGPG